MNNTFLFERFVKVLKYDLKFRVPGIATAFVLLLVIAHVIRFMFDLGGTFSPTEREIAFQAGWMFLSFYAPFVIYSAVSKKHGRASFIMLPASGLEKFASMFAISVLVIPVAFFLSAYLLDSLLVALFKEKYIDFLSLKQLDIWLCYKCILCSVATALLGRVLFRKRAVGKTILCVLAATTLWCYCAGKFIAWNFSDVGTVDGEAVEVQLIHLKDITQYVYLIVSAIIYSLTYLRIKKMQIS